MINNDILRQNSWFQVGVFSLATVLLLTMGPSLSVPRSEMAWVGGYSILGCIFLIVVSTVHLHKDHLTPYLLFQATTAVFMGGRFLGALLGVPADVFTDTNFIPVVLDSQEIASLIVEICTSQLLIHVGYLTCCTLLSQGTLGQISDKPLMSASTIAAVLLLVSTAVGSIGAWNHVLAARELGYMGIYTDQSADNLSRFSSIAQYGLLLGTGLAFSGRVRWVEYVGLLLLGVYYTLYLALGLRSGFIGFALLAVWIIHFRYRRLNLLYTAVILVLLFGAAEGAVKFGFRSMTMNSDSSLSTLAGEPVADGVEIANTDRSLAPGNRSGEAPIDLAPSVSSPDVDSPDAQVAELAPIISLSVEFKERVGWFLYLQGSTLVYTAAARRIESYPQTATLQSFLPGFSIVWQRLHPQTEVSDFYFPHFLAKALSAERFEDGYGVGWSLVSDLHAMSQDNRVVKILMAFTIGAFLCYVLVSSRTSAYFLGLTVTIVPKLMLLPRAGIYSIVPYVFAFSVIYLFAVISSQIYRRLFDDRDLREGSAGGSEL